MTRTRHRLNVFPLRVPPLRERPEDLAVLTAHFAGKHAARFGRRIARIERQTLKRLESQSWPGNVRELENVIARAVVTARDEVLRIPTSMLPGAGVGRSLDAQLRSSERGAIEAALLATRGRIAGTNGAAKRLGLAPSTLESRLERMGIDKFHYRSR